jgi:hypothetical protein
VGRVRVPHGALPEGRKTSAFVPVWSRDRPRASLWGRHERASPFAPALPAPATTLSGARRPRTVIAGPIHRTTDGFVFARVAIYASARSSDKWHSSRVSGHRRARPSTNQPCPRPRHQPVAQTPETDHPGTRPSRRSVRRPISGIEKRGVRNPTWAKALRSCHHDLDRRRRPNTTHTPSVGTWHRAALTRTHNGAWGDALADVRCDPRLCLPSRCLNRTRKANNLTRLHTAISVLKRASRTWGSWPQTRQSRSRRATRP